MKTEIKTTTNSTVYKKYFGNLFYYYWLEEKHYPCFRKTNRSWKNYRKTQWKNEEK